jgi:hypothetical protein
MLVSHSHRFIFIKTPKTAGTSVELFFEPCCVPPGSKVSPKSEARQTEHGIVGFRGRVVDQETRQRWFNHQSAADLAQALPAAVWAGYFKFATVRNPFSRAVSQFLFRRRVWSAQNGDFDEAYRDFGVFLDRDVGLTHQALLAIGRDGVIDDAIRFESLSGDVDRIARQIGFDTPPMPLLHTKKGADPRMGRPVADFFDAQRTATILERESWCFETFGYDESPERAGSVGDNAGSDDRIDGGLAS